MAFPSFLELVNDVLVRLREPEVSTVNENVLSKLVGKMVNDSKRQVEDAYNWNALTATLTLVTIPSVFNYALVGTGNRFKTIDVWDSTSATQLSPVSTRQMNENFLLGNITATIGAPSEYNFNGVSSLGDVQVDIWPVPDRAYTVFFNLYVPQEALVADSDQLMVPKEPVILLAKAMALVERGEDGGLSNSEAYGIFKSSLSDAIALESSRYPDEDSWEWV
jgi:hypothetical protein